MTASMNSTCSSMSHHGSPSRKLSIFSKTWMIRSNVLPTVSATATSVSRFKLILHVTRTASWCFSMESYIAPFKTVGDRLDPTALAQQQYALRNVRQIARQLVGREFPQSVHRCASEVTHAQQYARRPVVALLSAGPISPLQHPLSKPDAPAHRRFAR